MRRADVIVQICSQLLDRGCGSGYNHRHGGIDNEDIETARRQAAAVLESHPDLRGMMLWQASLGVQLPQAIDTGIDVTTQQNFDAYLARAA